MVKKFIFIVFISLCLFINVGCDKGENESTQISHSNNLDEEKENEILSVKKMREDLNYLKENVISTYPRFSDDKFKEEYLGEIEEMYNKINKSMNKEEFYFLVLRAVTPLKDGHGGVVFSENINDTFYKKVIPIKFIWLEKELLINNDEGVFKKGDKILKIGGKDSEEILKELEEIIVADNKYFIKGYINYYLRYKPILKELGLVNDKGLVEIEYINADEKIKSETVPFIDKEISKQNIVYDYTIYENENIGLFKLNRCDLSEGLLKKLDTFFEEINKKKINRIAFDLRQGSSGSPEFIEEFLKYISINEYDKYYISKDINKTNVRTTVNIENTKKSDTLYDGDIYILTSYKTVSSGVLFAKTLKINNLAKTIGEPTGTSVTFSGRKRMYKLPNSEFLLSVSDGFYISPDKDASNSLSPDVYIPITRDSFVMNEDVILEWLLNSKIENQE